MKHILISSIAVLLLMLSCTNNPQKNKNPLNLNKESFGILDSDPQKKVSNNSVDIAVELKNGMEYSYSNNFNDANQVEVLLETSNIEIPLKYEVKSYSSGKSRYQYGSANTIVSFNRSRFQKVISKRIIGNHELMFNDQYNNKDSLSLCITLSNNIYSALKNSWLLVKVKLITGATINMVLPITTNYGRMQNERKICKIDSIDIKEMNDIVVSNENKLFLFYEHNDQIIFDFFNNEGEKHPFFEIDTTYNYITIATFKQEDIDGHYDYNRYAKKNFELTDSVNLNYWFGTYNFETEQITSTKNSISVQREISPEYSAITLTSGNNSATTYIPPSNSSVLDAFVKEYFQAQTSLTKCNYAATKSRCNRNITKLIQFISTQTNKSTIEEAKLILSEFQNIQFNASNGLDIYGNPPGWVPLISYEINKAAFKNEIDYATNAIYISYVLNDASQTLQSRIKKLNNAIEKLKTENKELEIIDKDLLYKIESDSVLLNEMTAIQDICNNNIEQIAKALKPRAQRNVTKRSIGRFVSFVSKTVASVAVVIPGGQAVALVAAGVAVLANTVADIDIDDPLSLENLEVIAKNAGDLAASMNDVSQCFNEEQTNATTTTAASETLTLQKKKKSQKQQAVANNTAKYAACVQSSLSNTTGAIRAFQGFPGQIARSKKVEKELKSLLSKDSNYKLQTNILKGAIDSVIVLSNAINQKLSTYSSNENKIQRNLELIILKGEAKEKNLNSLSPTQILTINNLKNAAMKRLFKYHYLMAKAYEYRLIKPFPEKNNYDIESFISNVQKTIKAANGEINEKVIEKSSILFSEILQDINSEILNNFNNGNELLMHNNVYYSLSKSEIEQLNTNNNLELNLYEIENLFPPNLENIRLVEISVASCKFSNDHVINANQNQAVNLNLHGSNYIDLKFIHSGISTIQKEGLLYRFNHINGDNPDLINWNSHIDLIGNCIQNENISEDSKSLLLDAVGKDEQGDLTLFSTPSVNSKLLLKAYYNSNQKFNSIVLKVKYNKQDLDNNYKIIKVSSNINSPNMYYNFSIPDINGLQHSGRNKFQRCYPLNKELQIETLNRIDNFKFKKWQYYKNGKWSDFDGGTNNPFTIKISDHKVVKAIFEEIS